MSKRVNWGFGLVYILLFAALIQAECSHADGVYTCTKAGATNYQSCGDTNTVITKQIKADTLVAVTDGCPPGPSSFWYCPGMKWLPAASTVPATLIGMCGGSETDLQKCAFGNGGMSAVQPRSTLEGVVWPGSFVFTAKGCYPHVKEELRWNGSYLHGIVLWYCDMPRGVVAHSYVWGLRGAPMKTPPTDVPNPGQVSDTQATEILRSLTDHFQEEQEHQAVVAFDDQYGLKAYVVNGSSTVDAPTYSANKDFTRGALLKKRVKLGAECAPAFRLVTISKGVETGTNYYALIIKNPVPGEQISYAQCQLNGPISK